MPKRHVPYLRLAAALAVAVALTGCTKSGQFDPTEWLNSDTFDTKTKLKGQRTPVFPDGVPGAQTGVPPDLVKGYQAPPDEVATPAPPPAQAEAKPKPKPKVAAVPKQAPTRINIGGAPKGSAQSAAPAQPSAPAASSGWPPPQSAPASQGAQTDWPAPPSTAPAQQTSQPAQTNWPTPPSTTTH